MARFGGFFKLIRENSMRNLMRKRLNQRFTCRGTVARFGEKPSFRGPPVETVLFSDVVDAETNAPLTDHVWFTCGKWSLGIRTNDVVEFDARITEYEKGYKGYRMDVQLEKPLTIDYRLSRPTHVRVVGKKSII